jgi:hypothetical protein
MMRPLPSRTSPPGGHLAIFETDQAEEATWRDEPYRPLSNRRSLPGGWRAVTVVANGSSLLGGMAPR